MWIEQCFTHVYANEGKASPLPQSAAACASRQLPAAELLLSLKSLHRSPSLPLRPTSRGDSRKRRRNEKPQTAAAAVRATSRDSETRAAEQKRLNLFNSAVVSLSQRRVAHFRLPFSVSPSVLWKCHAICAPSGSPTLGHAHPEGEARIYIVIVLKMDSN